MDVREAIGILETSLNIDCSLKEGIREVEARMVVAEVAKRDLERQKGCKQCQSCGNCANYETMCPVDGGNPVCINEERTPADKVCKNFMAVGYCQFCGKNLEEE